MSQPGAEQAATPTTSTDAAAATITPTPAPATATTQTGTTAPQASASGAKVFDEAYVQQLRAENADWRTKYQAANTELGTLKQQGMSESEKALAAARDEGRLEVRTQAAEQLTLAEFRVQAATAGVPADRLSDLIEDLDLKKFVTPDLAPDVKRIQTKASAWAALATPAQQRTSFDGGPRGTAQQTDMNSIIRAQVGITPQ